MQSTQEVAALLSIPAASVRRIKKQLGTEIVEGFHFVRQGTRLLWTAEGVDALSHYLHDNPFAGLLEGADLYEDEEDEAA
jgi:hypothetical protein